MWPLPAEGLSLKQNTDSGHTERHHTPALAFSLGFVENSAPLSGKLNHFF